MLNKLRKLFSKKETIYTSSNPENTYKTIITDEFIKVEQPNRKPEIIHWEDIDEIWLINTDEGPFFPDVWLALYGKKEGCTLPQGTKGFEEVFDIVSKYKNFSFENFIDSMSCSENKRFILWKREQ